eukprot:3979031-Alexandrium_andersonii.AAC.1
MPGAAWLRIVGPSSRRSIASWRAARSVTAAVQGTADAWSTPHVPPPGPAAPAPGGDDWHVPARPAQAA